ncbi:MAG: hypothetical protein ACKOFT_05180, partial [Actinomycetota bacterium]
MDFDDCEECSMRGAAAKNSSWQGYGAGAPRAASLVWATCCLALLACLTGCRTFGRPQLHSAQQALLDSQCPPNPEKMPAKELAKVTLPAYVIEPPDILMV